MIVEKKKSLLSSEVITDLNNRLFVAIGNGSPLKVIRDLLYSGADVNAVSTQYRNTVLHIAVANGDNREVVELLIDEGADVNAVDKDGRAALRFAGDLELLALLIDKGADVNAVDNRGKTVLHDAVLCGTSEIIKLLIDKGANINAVNQYGHTVLHLAIIANREVVELLIDEGADVNAVNISGDTALHAAVASGASREVIEKFIKEGINIYQLNKNEEAVLYLACLYELNEEIIKLLMDAEDNLSSGLVSQDNSFKPSNENTNDKGDGYKANQGSSSSDSSNDAKKNGNPVPSRSSKQDNMLLTQEEIYTQKAIAASLKSKPSNIDNSNNEDDKANSSSGNDDRSITISTPKGYLGTLYNMANDLMGLFARNVIFIDNNSGYVNIDERLSPEALSSAQEAIINFEVATQRAEDEITYPDADHSSLTLVCAAGILASLFMSS